MYRRRIVYLEALVAESKQLQFFLIHLNGPIVPVSRIVHKQLPGEYPETAVGRGQNRHTSEAFKWIPERVFNFQRPDEGGNQLPAGSKPLLFNRIIDNNKTKNGQCILDFVDFCAVFRGKYTRGLRFLGTGANSQTDCERYEYDSHLHVLQFVFYQQLTIKTKEILKNCLAHCVCPNRIE